MLSQMRSSFKKLSWTLWLVIFAFVGGFVLTDAFRGEERTKSGLLYVNDEEVANGGDYQRLLMRTLDNYKEQFKERFNKSMITQMRLPEQMLQGMIDTAVIKKEARRLDIGASQDEISYKIVNNPAFQRNGKFIGTANYRRLLAYSKMDVVEFEAQVKDEVIREKFQELVTASLVIDNDTLRQEYKKEKDMAELDYIVFKTSRIKENPEPAESELTAYYEEHKEEFKSPEKRAGFVIAYKFDDFKSKVTVSPKKIYDYFLKNKADFIVPGKTKVSRIFLKYTKENREEVFKKIESLQKEMTVENFADYAQAYSEDDKAKSGGDHGYSGWNNFTSQERAIIENLNEGQISTPIDTLQGFSVVFISEKVAQTEPVFNEAQEKIKGILEEEAVKDHVKEQLQKVYNKLKDAENIKAKASEQGVPVIETGLITHGQPVKDVDEMGYIARRLFIMKDKEIAFPVNFVKGIAIVQLASIEEPAVLPYEEMKDRVTDKVVTAKKVELLKLDAEKAAEQLNAISDEKKIEEFLKKEDLKTQPFTYKRGNRFAYFPAEKGMDKTIFAAAENRFAEPLVFSDQVVIYKIKKKSIVDDSNFQENRKEFYAKKLSSIRGTYFNSYIDHVKKDYEITLNQELFQQIKDWIMARYN